MLTGPTCFYYQRFQYLLDLPRHEIEFPPITNVTASESIVLNCGVKSYPKAMIIWQKNNETITSGIKTVTRKTTFFYIILSNIQLVNLTKGNHSEYTCKAVNGIGLSIQRTHMNIQCERCFSIF